MQYCPNCKDVLFRTNTCPKCNLETIEVLKCACGKYIVPHTKCSCGQGIEDVKIPEKESWLEKLKKLFLKLFGKK